MASLGLERRVPRIYNAGAGNFSFIALRFHAIACRDLPLMLLTAIFTLTNGWRLR